MGSKEGNPEVPSDGPSRAVTPANVNLDFRSGSGKGGGAWNALVLVGCFLAVATVGFVIAALCLPDWMRFKPEGKWMVNPNFMGLEAFLANTNADNSGGNGAGAESGGTSELPTTSLPLTSTEPTSSTNNDTTITTSQSTENTSQSAGVSTESNETTTTSQPTTTTTTSSAAPATTKKQEVVAVTSEWMKRGLIHCPRGPNRGCKDTTMSEKFVFLSMGVVSLISVISVVSLVQKLDWWGGQRNPPNLILPIAGALLLAIGLLVNFLCAKQKADRIFRLNEINKFLAEPVEVAVKVGVAYFLALGALLLLFCSIAIGVAMNNVDPGIRKGREWVY